MGKLWLIAKSNIKKRKGNMITLFIMAAIAVVLMYSCLNVILNVGSFVGEKSEAQNGAHVCIIASANYKEQVSAIVAETPHFESMEVVERQMTTNACDIINLSKKDENKEENKDTMALFFQDMEESHAINHFIIIDQGTEKKDNSIILPMYLKVAAGYQTGDEIQIKINQTTQKFVVYGFTEDVMFASPANIPAYSCQITQSMLEKLASEKNTVMRYQYNIRLDQVEASEEFEGAVLKNLTEQMTQADFITDYCMNITTMIMGSTTMISIIMSILIVFAVVLVIIIVFVIRFNLMMYLEENFVNIGIMEAQGYTTKQLRTAMLMEYLTVCAAGIICGFVLSGACSQVIASLVSGSIGHSWTPSVDIGVGIGVGLFVIIFVSFIVVRTASKIRRISTLDAMRGGIEAHNFRRNHLPLAKSKLDINTCLGLKSLFHNARQNIGIFVIVCLLSFASVLMLLSAYNFVADDKSLLTLVGTEYCDIEVLDTDRTQAEWEQLFAEMEQRTDVDYGLLGGSMMITICNDTDELAVNTDVYSDFNKLRIKSLYEGREPKQENEIVVTTVVAKRFALEVGDSVQVKVGDHTASYIVCGISQQMSNMGISSRMSREALKRLNPEFGYQKINLYVKEGEEIDAVVDRLENEYAQDESLKISNYTELFGTIMGSFTSAITAMCSIPVVITIIVVAMIITMMMRMKMMRERKLIGIYKALGYTTGQIVWQMIMAFAPIVTLGGIVGALLGALCVDDLFVLILSSSGIKNVSLQIHGGLVAASIIGITLLAFAVSMIVSTNVRTIEPYKMIVEE